MSNEGPKGPRKETPRHESNVDPELKEYLHDYKMRAETFITFAHPDVPEFAKEAVIMALDLIEPGVMQDGINRQDQTMYQGLGKEMQFRLWMSINLFSEKEGEFAAVIHGIENNPDLTDEQQQEVIQMMSGLEDLLIGP